MQEEIILPIKDYPGYFATSKGRILSTKVHGPNPIKEGYHEKPGYLNSSGYLLVTLVRIRRKTLSVHSLILKTFKGIDPIRNYANHINGIKTDNRPENLEWVTRSENELHKHRVLGIPSANLGKGRLSIKIQEEIYLKYKEGNLNMRKLCKTVTVTQRSLSQEYGVTQSRISDVIIRLKLKDL